MILTYETDYSDFEIWLDEPWLWKAFNKQWELIFEV